MRLGAACRRTAAAVVLALLAAVPARAQQPQVVVADVGPHFSGRILQAALAGPHLLVEPGEGTVTLERGARHPSTIVVLGRSATVASQVRGDVIVVGGDLFVRPGALIEGRAVAIGGTATTSTLAIVRDGTLSFRDETFDVDRAPAGGYALRYRALRPATKPFALPGLYGLRVPTYDRVNGLSLPVAPSIALDSARLEIEPGVTYRSHLGAFDPALAVRYQPTRRTSLALTAARATFTNDAWIYGDLINSLTTLALGNDTRNYYRADRAEARLARKWEGPTWQHEPFVGVRWERAWSVGADSLVPGAPWSLFGRTSEDHMRRPNPRVDDGHLSSALAGIRFDWEPPGGLRATGSLETETALSAPGDARFGQATLDGKVTFPAFRTHRFEFEAHALLTVGDTAPAQRWAYLGGSGTLRTLELLEQGGDQLVFLESRYVVPLVRPVLPLLGAPTVTLRHVLGAAGVGRLPALEQEIGLRLGLGLLRADVVANPGRETVRLSAGVSFAR